MTLWVLIIVVVFATGPQHFQHEYVTQEECYAALMETDRHLLEKVKSGSVPVIEAYSVVCEEQ